MRAARMIVIWLLPAVIAAGCGGSQSSAPQTVLRILSASENQTLEPIVQRFASQHNAGISFAYQGSVDIELALEGGVPHFDAVWPSNSLWISLGDKQHIVKDQESIMRSPVILAVKKSVARRLGWIGRPVRVEDILRAAGAGKFRYMMTSASQSNSGASAYFGYLYAFAGNPPILTAGDLQKRDLRQKIKRILGTINRSSASSGWLKTLFLQKYDYFDGMVNYESVVIETNQALVKEGKEPLYAIYPVDGLAIADSPLGYVDHGDKTKAKLFHQLQSYLLTPQVQREILQTGRRTGLLGLDPSSAPKAEFNPAWGIDVARVINPIRFPRAPVIQQALTLYQTAFRKPSLTVFVIDFSGSMADNGGEDGVKSAMKILLDQQVASKYLLQTSPQDVTVVIPFSDSPQATWKVAGNNPAKLQGLLDQINATQANGGTAIFSAVMNAYDVVKRYPGGTDRFPSIILMTDGQNNEGASWDDLRHHIDQIGLRDVPVYAITFGEADPSQLSQITQYTSGQIFDGHKDLVTAFRSAKGYNS